MRHGGSGSRSGSTSGGLWMLTGSRRPRGLRPHLRGPWGFRLVSVGGCASIGIPVVLGVSVVGASSLEMDERDAVVAWRFWNLLEAGYEDYEAEVLARRFDVDWHVACELVERGCEKALALEILL